LISSIGIKTFILIVSLLEKGRLNNEIVFVDIDGKISTFARCIKIMLFYRSYGVHSLRADAIRCFVDAKYNGIIFLDPKVTLKLLHLEL